MGITDLTLTQELTQYPPLIFNLQENLNFVPKRENDEANSSLFGRCDRLCKTTRIPAHWMVGGGGNRRGERRAKRKAVEEASHVLKRMQLGRQRASSMLHSQMANKQDDDVTTMSPADYEAYQEYLRAKYSFGGPGIRV